MDSMKHIFARDDTSNDTVINLMIVLLSLIFVALLSIAVLVLLRRIRQRRQMDAETLPQYNEINKRSGNHRGLTIQTGHVDSYGEKTMGRTSVVIFRDGQPMLANPNSPPHSPDNVPEIHITFPDEQDEQGRRKSGRVVVVRVGDATVGLEPLRGEQLPAYEKESSTQFYAIDLEKIGGLKEKEREDYY